MTWGVKFWSQQLISLNNTCLASTVCLKVMWPYSCFTKGQSMKTVFETVNQVQMQKKFFDMKCLTIKWNTHICWKKKKQRQWKIIWGYIVGVWNIRNKRNMKTAFSKKTGRTKPQLVLVSVCSQLGDIANWI